MILLSYGTRPEYIKIKSLIAGMKEREISHRVLFTGQHEDISNGNYDFKIKIEAGDNRLNSITRSILDINDEVFDGVSYVLVQGDTTSAMAMALAAFHRDIKVIHLEAGLRTNNRDDPYPEEMNRQLISRLASIHLCPTETNRINLNVENIYHDVYVVGNTGLDGIDNSNISYNNDIIVTLHRRENHKHIPRLFTIINDIAGKNTDLNFIIPLHPNPNVQKYKYLIPNLKVIDPVSHSEMIKMVSKCRFVISDSGGLQEEASYLKKKIIVCRKTTERPETIGTYSNMCSDYRQLEHEFERIKDNYMYDGFCPYGDGHASEKILAILNMV